MYDICCIGHITLDKVVTPNSVVHMAGGTAFYFSNAIHNMDVRYLLITALAQKDMNFVSDLRISGIEVKAWPSEHTVYFENIYLENQDQRTQRVLQMADAFTIEQLAGIQASVFHLGPLLADDIPVELISTLSGKGMISLDVQGYLRKVRHEMVCAIDWVAKKDVLKHVDILKADENEMEIITGYADPRRSAKVLSEWGVKEVVITLGSRGSVIYKDHDFYDIPAYRPGTFVDATGCGDTYMAGYLYQRVRGATIQDAGEFAAAMATLKIETSGPFTGTKEAVLELAIDDKRKMGSK